MKVRVHRSTRVWPRTGRMLPRLLAAGLCLGCMAQPLPAAPRGSPGSAVGWRIPRERERSLAVILRPETAMAGLGIISIFVGRAVYRRRR